MLTSLFSLFYVTGEFHRFLHRGRARFLVSDVVLVKSTLKSPMSIISVPISLKLFRVSSKVELKDEILEFGGL